MHSALLWCCCHHEDWRVIIASFMTAQVKLKSLPELFWKHLRKDIEHLSKVSGKGIEEAALIIHMVLSEILTKPGKCVCHLSLLIIGVCDNLAIILCSILSMY